MRKIFGTFVILLSATLIQSESNDEIERVAGFARLYGVVRYFHPSDAAQEVDWNRFVIHGAREIQKTKTPAEYQAALVKLFGPITSGMHIDDSNNKAATHEEQQAGDDMGKLLVTWQHFGPGAHSMGGPYTSQRINRKIPVDGFVTMMQSIDAKPLRGRTVRLAGFARAENATEKTGAAI